MAYQTSAIAAVMLVAAAMSRGQIPSDMRTTERAIFFSGEVTLEDGSKPVDPVLIQRICKGSSRDEAWTDSNGRFSFKVAAGGSDTSTADASQAPARNPELSRPIGNSTVYSNPVTAALRDCEVQAVLAGFWSKRVSIAVKNTLDDTRIGLIILHPLSRDQARTVSATTLAAPSNAKKAYEKGMTAIREQRWDAAISEFTKAVTVYPKFAAAWFELGLLRQSRKDIAGAAEAWKAALNCDPRYVKPYEGLAAIAERQENWADLEKYTREWIQLTPEGFPAAYLYNAVANARLNNPDQAEAAARQGLRFDKDGKFPRMSYVLGLILMQKKEFGEAAKCLRTYLELAPNARDAAIVRQELTRLEAAAAAAAPK